MMRGAPMGFAEFLDVFWPLVCLMVASVAAAGVIAFVLVRADRRAVVKRMHRARRAG